MRRKSRAGVQGVLDVLSSTLSPGGSAERSAHSARPRSFAFVVSLARWRSYRLSSWFFGYFEVSFQMPFGIHFLEFSHVFGLPLGPRGLSEPPKTIFSSFLVLLAFPRVPETFHKPPRTHVLEISRVFGTSLGPRGCKSPLRVHFLEFSRVFDLPLIPRGLSEAFESPISRVFSCF